MQIVRHLNGKTSSVFQEGDKTCEKAGMVRKPLQDGIGEYQVETLLRLPARDVSLLKVSIRQSCSGLGEHVGRIVEPEYTRCRIAAGDQFRAVSGSASDIDAIRCFFQGHAPEQVAGWPGALIFELQILSRVPIGQRKALLVQARSVAKDGCAPYSKSYSSGAKTC